MGKPGEETRTEFEGRAVRRLFVHATVRIQIKWIRQ
jgi:hypothetical protein